LGFCSFHYDTMTRRYMSVNGGDEIGNWVPAEIPFDQDT